MRVWPISLLMDVSRALNILLIQVQAVVEMPLFPTPFPLTLCSGMGIESMTSIEGFLFALTHGSVSIPEPKEMQHHQPLLQGAQGMLGDVLTGHAVALRDVLWMSAGARADGHV